ncbi:hypothetical protein MD537_05910 [Flavihumibacter sediminis]|nr:hypothetical protein [Flavihumibacter sediminis]
MKKLFQLNLVLFSFMILFLAACSKQDVVKPIPGGGNGGNGGGNQKTSIRFQVASLPGEVSAVNGLYAVISMVNGQQQPVWTAKKIALPHNGAYLTDSIIVEAGNYRVTSVMIMNAAEKVLFVSPMANSHKANEVSKPLPFGFQAVKNSRTDISLELSKVNPTDQPEMFGYPAGSFNQGNVPVDPFMKIIVHPLIKIGDVVYDSIPVTYRLMTWDANGGGTVVHGTFKPGKNELTLLRSAIRYQIAISKWGTRDELTLEKADVQEGTVYTMGGSREAKKLRAEYSFQYDNGNFKPITKAAYEYASDGTISQIIHYRKKADNTTYVDMTDKFEYNGLTKPSRIIRYNESNSIIAENMFTYDAEGRVITMKKKEVGVETNAQVQYSLQPGGTGITGNYDVMARYDYSNSPIDMTYTMRFIGGNNMSDAATTSNHSSEVGSYQYDFNINPFIHISLPDLLQPARSRHNATVEVKSYHGSYPEFVAYDFQYKYDADGYPIELIKSYKSYLTGIFAFKTKTVYSY